MQERLAALPSSFVSAKSNSRQQRQNALPVREAQQKRFPQQTSSDAL
jgi:hypothetical protein